MPLAKIHTAILTLTAFAATLLSCNGATTAPASVDLARFENEIKAFETHDQKSPPPKDGILFVGSSTFTKWKNIEKDFPGLPVFNRGFGGSTMAELNYYIDRIVLPYKPKQIIVYEGTNDVAAGQSAERVFDGMKAFHEKVHAALPNTQIYFLPLIPAPSRVKFIAEMDRANKMLSDYIAKHAELHLLDARFLWSDEKGQPDETLYIIDRLHPNRPAYEKLIPIIRKTLESAPSLDKKTP
jgi:lysophospholipase L1-like esterase